jgi:hypothetical protein
MSRRFQFSVRALLVVAAGCSQPGAVPGMRSTVVDTITVPVTAQSRGTDEQRGREILLSSARAYSALRSYAGTVDLSADVAYPTGNHHESRQGRILYRAPNALRIDENDSNNDRFCIVLPDKTASNKDVLQEYAGVSLHLTVLLPSLLLGTNWDADNFSVPKGPLLPAFASKARYLEDETVSGVLCHKVACEREIGTWMFYVGVDDALIRRVENNESEGQMAVQRELGCGGISGQIMRSHTVQVFDIEAIDGEIDAALFEGLQ